MLFLLVTSLCSAAAFDPQGHDEADACPYLQPHFSVDPVDFEGVLISKGQTLRPVDDYQFMMSGQHRFVLQDPKDRRVVTLYLPGGFEAQASEIDQALRTSLAHFEQERLTHDWSISVRPNQLIDIELWEAVTVGLQVALQPSDAKPNSDRWLQIELLHVVSNLVTRFSRDVASIRLTADFGQDQAPNVVRLVVDFKPDTESVAFFNTGSRGGILDFDFDPERMPPLVGAMHVVRGPALQVSGGLKEWPLALGQSQLSANHLLFALDLKESDPQPTFFTVFSHADQALRKWNDVVPLVMLKTELSRSFNVSSTHPSALVDPRMRAWFGSITATPGTEPNPSKVSAPVSKGFFLMKLDLRQVVSIIYPKLEYGQTAPQTVVSVNGHFEGNRLTLSAEFPAGSEVFVYLLFEDVFCRLKRLGETLSFDTFLHRK